MTLQGGGMVYEGLLPLRLEPLATLPPPVLLAGINESNEILLGNVLMLDDKTELGEHDEVMAELRRQDQKLRLVLDLLGTLLMQHDLLPSPQHLRFSGERLSLPAGLAPPLPDTSLVKCSLYLDASLPKPVILHAHTAAGEAEEGGVIWKHYEFTGVSQGVQDQLEKFIFRQHRRAVAQQRRQ